MSLFTKKPDGEPRVPMDLPGPPPPPAGKSRSAPRFGIAGAMALLRSLPGDDKNELVVRVVRATLAAVDVHFPEIIEDAARRQKSITERIAAIHGQMAELERQLEHHRHEISTLEAELKETSSVKDRLEHAEKTAVLAAGPPRPPAPPMTKTPTPEPTVRTTHETFKD